MAAGAAAGQLHVMIWLHARGCPNSWQVTTTAANAGKLKVCLWLLDNGYADYFGKAVLCAVLEAGHPEIMDSLLQHQPNLQALGDVLYTIARAAEDCGLETLQRLYSEYLLQLNDCFPLLPPSAPLPSS